MAIVPARGGSKRLPRKNVLPLAGRPMILHPLQAARESGVFDAIIVSTEDPEIADICARAGYTVRTRPMELATDAATVVQVCAHVLSEEAKAAPLPSSFCCIYATAAFIHASDLAESFAQLEADPECEVVMSVSAFPIHPFKALVRRGPYLTSLWPDKIIQKGQINPPCFGSNGTFYWARSKTFLDEPTFYSERMRGFVLKPERAVDIDTPEDYAHARELMKLRPPAQDRRAS